MDLFELLQRGYFPKELPPSFNTYKFALKGGDLLAMLNGNVVSAPALYSVEKNDVSRRVIHIPNPANYLKLADVVVRNETAIWGSIPSSPYSNSRAYYDSEISKRCIAPKQMPLFKLKREKLKMAMTKRYEVKIDVANFYPTVYTHSITWAMLGREKAKQIWSLSTPQRRSYTPASDVQLYEIGNQIDKAIRNCNEQQTHGILVGPDVSFLIGELIMSRIDANVSALRPDLKGTRYYDDYTFYVDSEEDANSVYQTLQSELRHFGLEINDAKFEKRKAPCSIQDEHAREISPIRIDKDQAKRGEDILHLFDVMWKCAELKPEKTLTIFKYGLRLLINRRIKIDTKNEGLYELLLYKTAIIKPSVLPQICQILDFSGKQSSADLMAETLDAIFKSYIPYAQDNEVAWALWICKKYEIDIALPYVCQILDMGSAVCCIILLDILHHRQKQMLLEEDVKTRIDMLSRTWNKDSLYSQDWLLMYEASEHGWIDSSAIISQDPFFKKLHDEEVMFYDENIAADYSSYDYIEKLPYDYYPPATKDDAKVLKDKIIDRIREKAFDMFYDDEADGGPSEDEIYDMIDSEIEDLDFEDELFNKILNPVFRGEDVDEEKLVNEFLDRIELYNEY